jgi:phage baseplate assembly protein W
MPEFQSFTDFNFNFKPHPVTGDLMLVRDAADIKQSIRSLLLTQRGERLFNSKIGTGLTKLLFDPLDFATSAQIRDEILTVLSNYERRIRVLALTVDPNFDDNGYDINLTYNIVGRDDVPTTTEFFLESAR